MPPNRASFSQGKGFSPPKEIVYRDELPLELRFQIFNILRRYTAPAFLWERIETLLNPYGSDALPAPSSPIPISKEEDHPQIIAAKTSTCELLVVPCVRHYRGHSYGQLDFYEAELINALSSEVKKTCERFRSNKTSTTISCMVGIGWRLVNGEDCRPRR